MEIFEEVKKYLSSGNVNGIFDRLLSVTETLILKVTGTLPYFFLKFFPIFDYESMRRDASKSNFIDPGDHRESPLQYLVGAGLRACPKMLHFERL